MKQTNFDNQSAAKPLPQTQLTENEFLDYVQNKKGLSDSSSITFHFVAADDKMLRIKDIISQVANTTVPVLITGESGTGKEVVARTIHESSNRKDKPFVAINCAALPSSLLESELFGYEKGAFTGAHQRHIGKFEQACGGTLLLDEVTEIDASLQAKLLRALQEKEIERIGGTGPIKVDTRIIATTNRDIAKSVLNGGFRQDLYYRLYVINLEIPPLRSRPKDIELLANHFLTQYATQFKRQQMQFSPKALEKLVSYSWPGNVRELQNIIQRTILMSKADVIQADDVPVKITEHTGSLEWVRLLPIGQTMQQVETHFIIETLRNHNGNRTHAAKTLGISLRTLRNKINEFTAAGFEVPAPTTGKAL